MAVFCVISTTLVAFSTQKYSPTLVVLAVYYLWRYSQWITPSEGVKVRNSPVVR